MVDDELTPAELHYFQTGDASAVLAEQDSRSTPETASDDGLSDAELRAQPDAPMSPKVKKLLDDHAAALQNERIRGARLEERLDLMTQAISPAPPALPPQPEQPTSRYRDFDTDPYGAMKDITDHARELEVVGRYRATLDDAVRREPAVLEAYQHAMLSETLQHMARHFPGATVQELYQAVADRNIPPEIRRAVEESERNTFVNSPDPITEIIRIAQLRGWVSPQMRAAQKAAADDQRRREEAARAEQQRQAEEAEAEWKRKIAMRVAAIPGMSFEDALREVLPRREDRMRYRHGSKAYSDHGYRY